MALGESLHWLWLWEKKGSSEIGASPTHESAHLCALLYTLNHLNPARKEAAGICFADEE